MSDVTILPGSSALVKEKAEDRPVSGVRDNNGENALSSGEEGMLDSASSASSELGIATSSLTRLRVKRGVRGVGRKCEGDPTGLFGGDSVMDGTATAQDSAVGDSNGAVRLGSEVRGVRDLQKGRRRRRLSVVNKGVV